MKNSFTKTVLGNVLMFSTNPHRTKFGILYTLACPKLQWQQDFDAEDLARLLASEDFEFLIADELRRQQSVKNRRIQIRVTEDEQSVLEKKAIAKGYKNTSTYIRDLALS